MRKKFVRFSNSASLPRTLLWVPGNGVVEAINISRFYPKGLFSAFFRTDAMLLESLRHKTVAFVGDSRIRHLCMRLLSALERIPFLLTSSNNHFHRDRRFYSKEFNTSLVRNLSSSFPGCYCIITAHPFHITSDRRMLAEQKFYWVVYPYEPRLKKILSRWARTTDPSPHIALFQFGAHSAWFPKHREKEHAYFKDGLTKTAKALKRIQYSQGTISVWMLTRIYFCSENQQMPYRTMCIIAIFQLAKVCVFQ
ncbi:hypothetical protein RvY_06870-2 [Ramazzottius varieornatus]|uniref:Uncharacterized protein n=1 Tax=Ramazzottius varieornatus TaxID=947166 RepID=A0A1D1V045_RAMVA|nr:hypothetical protein RvY_06870-2 [Ramazzottius varieornatus]